MLATLPMYDWPEVRSPTDRLWAAIAKRLGVDGVLNRTIGLQAAWHDPRLLLSQTCGYPFTHEFRAKLVYVATPHYNVPGCEGPNYSSFIFARENRPVATFRGSRAAINTPDSMSGMLALKLVTAPHARDASFFAEEILSGGHIHSLEMVRDGQADVCATDAVCVAMARRYRPGLMKGLVAIGQSPPVPALPFVTRVGDKDALRAALDAVFADKDLAEERNTLFLSGMSVLETSAYDRILDLERSL